MLNEILELCIEKSIGNKEFYTIGEERVFYRFDYSVQYGVLEISKYTDISEDETQKRTVYFCDNELDQALEYMQNE